MAARVGSSIRECAAVLSASIPATPAQLHAEKDMAAASQPISGAYRHAPSAPLTAPAATPMTTMMMNRLRDRIDPHAVICGDGG